MKYQQENKCKLCGNFFCCEKCRRRHEEQKHGAELEHIEKMKSVCVICQGEPLHFNPASISQEIFAHVVQKHLPLYCRKCNKVYTSEKDIATNWKCGTDPIACKLESAENPSTAINTPMTSPMHRQTISTQTSPGFSHLDVTKHHLIVTPTVPGFNMQPKLMTSDGSIMDSASSIRNAFSLSSSVPMPIPEVGKLVRTTSTPFERPELKLNPQHFDSSSQVSSIHGSSSESDLIVHSASSTNSNTKAKGKLQIARARSKMPVSATPLRQVLSKSIHRAIAEHGPISLRDKGFQPKKIFSSMNNSSFSLASPMDLRTSPVLRRSHSEVVDRTSTYEEFQTSTTSSRKQIISSSTRVITEDIIISSSNQVLEKLSTVYESCQTIESMRSAIDPNSQLLASSTQHHSSHQQQTPRKRSTAAEGAIKKTISFDTPAYKRRPAGEDELDDDVFFTPKSISVHKSNTSPNLNSSGSSLSPKHTILRKTSSYKVKSPNSPADKKENHKPISQTAGGFWSLVSSVVRLASFGGKDKANENQNEALGGVKRCSSFAGVINRKKSNDDDYITQQIKRKRTSTFGSHAEISLSTTDNEGDSVMGAPRTKRMKRIQGRRPIERMRSSRCDS